MAEVTLPQLGETVTEGTITQWFKQVGDTVAADEPLFEVSTDKVDTEVPSPVAGTLTEIRVPEGETVDVGTVIAVVGDGDGAPPREPAPAAEEAPRRGAAAGAGTEAPAAEERRPSPSRAAATEAPATETPAEEPEPADATADGAGRRHRPPSRAGTGADRAPAASSAKGVLLSPVVRRLVNEHGLDPAAINGSGPGGRITRDDVLDHIDKVGATPAAPQPEPAPGRRGAGREGRRRRPRGPGRAGARRDQAGAPRRPSPPGSATRRSS